MVLCTLPITTAVCSTALGNVQACDLYPLYEPELAQEDEIEDSKDDVTVRWILYNRFPEVMSV